MVNGQHLHGKTSTSRSRNMLCDHGKRRGEETTRALLVSMPPFCMHAALSRGGRERRRNQGRKVQVSPLAGREGSRRGAYRLTRWIHARRTMGRRYRICLIMFHFLFLFWCYYLLQVAPSDQSTVLTLFPLEGLDVVGHLYDIICRPRIAVVYVLYVPGDHVCKGFGEEHCTHRYQTALLRLFALLFVGPDKNYLVLGPLPGLRC